MASDKPRARRQWGRIYKLKPSGRYRASYTHNGKLYHPPKGTPGTGTSRTATFQHKGRAEGWLDSVKAQIDAGTWQDPAEVIEQADRKVASSVTVTEYARKRVAERTLTPRTRKGYEELIERTIAESSIGALPLSALSVTAVRSWYAALDSSRPTRRAHAYGLLHSVLRDAVDEQLIETNPAVERKAMNARRVRKIRALTAPQLTALINATAEELRAAVAVAGWCGLRAGELKGLRRRDIAADASVIHVERAVTYRSGVYYVGAPKTEAGVRDVSVPSRIRAGLLAHIATLADPRPDALVFPGAGGPEGYQTDWELRRAVGAAGKLIDPALFPDGVNPYVAQDLRPHELRHSAATLAAQTGATTKELMSRIGHTTPNQALQYQHAAAARDAEIADKLDRM
ncbi:putative prophage phiRv2 integrase [Rhodococcoides trifolii]|uniref:Prophage phiRv2 integrase n=1 Tax=Rhodococcoides trifolii TaxID=908250 RepID=A0A917FRL7_9NOCA|nr:site-specific integrase [Rhodococcus trifolii]GGG01741.1 putative prophage phiRv2 integrase [Rhodococcus trifolii]